MVSLVFAIGKPGFCTQDLLSSDLNLGQKPRWPGRRRGHHCPAAKEAGPYSLGPPRPQDHQAPQLGGLSAAEETKRRPWSRVGAVASKNEESRQKQRPGQSREPRLLHQHFALCCGDLGESVFWTPKC